MAEESGGSCEGSMESSLSGSPFDSISLPLSGCSQIRQGEETKKEEMYTLPQVMTIAATERNRYQKVYTSQIWEAVTDEKGTTMKDMLLSQIRTFLEDLETMNQLAESREIIISGAEQDRIQKLTDRLL